VDAAQALADLTEVSAQTEAAVVASPDGAVLASTLSGEAGTGLARAAVELLREGGDRAVAVGAATAAGSVFVARDGAHVVAAVTPRSAPSGLVLYDLRTCLGRLAEEPAKPKRKRAPRKKKEQEDERASP
jgi:predicted regulator of Ras-like GTPase activity (Roadblock/LC7/MglB family)